MPYVFTLSFLDAYPLPPKGVLVIAYSAINQIEDFFQAPFFAFA